MGTVLWRDGPEEVRPRFDCLLAMRKRLRCIVSRWVHNRQGPVAQWRWRLRVAEGVYASWQARCRYSARVRATLAVGLALRSHGIPPRLQRLPVRVAEASGTWVILEIPIAVANPLVISRVGGPVASHRLGRISANRRAVSARAEPLKCIRSMRVDMVGVTHAAVLVGGGILSSVLSHLPHVTVNLQLRPAVPLLLYWLRQLWLFVRLFVRWIHWGNPPHHCVVRIDSATSNSNS